MITKETEDAVLLYIDETHIRSYHVLRSTWSEVGRQKQVPTFGHHAHVSLFGAVNVHDGETVLHQTTAANAATFLDFLRMLKERYPDRLIVLVLDHARIQLVEMAERHRDRQCVSQTSKRYRPGHCSVCGRHPRTSAGSAATLRVCRMKGGKGDGIPRL
ncbi:transposase [Geobacillus thermoleovorans]|uniref:transposase n=1 Tax=Geobacillus thermoleovorans TaxID=33941 RepID=UPI003DA360A9